MIMSVFKKKKKYGNLCVYIYRFYGTKQCLSKRTYDIATHISNTFVLPSFFQLFN